MKAWRIYANDINEFFVYDTCPNQHSEFDNEPEEGYFLTNEELESIERAAFEAGRTCWNNATGELVITNDFDDEAWEVKFMEFEDYQKSKELKGGAK